MIRRTPCPGDPEGRVADVPRKVKPAERDALVLKSPQRARPPVA